MRNVAAERLLSLAQSNGLSISDLGFAQSLDEADPLKENRQLYLFPKRTAHEASGASDDAGENYFYMCGNSLGLQHVEVKTNINAHLDKWGAQAVEGHFRQPTPWFEMETSLNKAMGDIVGAQESEVVMMNGLTVNLHLLMTAFYKPNGKRRKIMCENQPFPSDTHAFVSQLEVRGLNPQEDMVWVTSPEQIDWQSQPVPIPTQNFLDAIEKHGDEVAIVVISAIHFLTGQLFDIAAITEAAHAKGIIVGVDCAHAVGNVPLKLHDWNVDFAVWCTYKYLNGGPGSMGGAFVHSKHTAAGTSLKWLRGWWGHDRRTRFSLHRNFEAAEGATAFQLSCTAAIALAAIQPSIRLFASVGMDQLREKSLILTAYLELLLNELIPAGCIEIITPADPAQRGAQLSVRILPNRLKSAASATEAYDCGNGTDCDADIAQRQLLDSGVMLDNRPPDIIRISPVPMYNNYSDVLHTVVALAALF